MKSGRMPVGVIIHRPCNVHRVDKQKTILYPYHVSVEYQVRHTTDDVPVQIALKCVLVRRGGIRCQV